MGGIALGKGVTSSGLLKVMDDGIRSIIGDLTLYPVVLVLSVIRRGTHDPRGPRNKNLQLTFGSINIGSVAHVRIIEKSQLFR